MMPGLRIFGVPGDLVGGGPARRGSAVRHWVGLATAITGVAGLTVGGVLLWLCGGSLTRAWWIGRPLIEVRSPRAGAALPQGGVQVWVVYPDLGRVAAETLHCELNGEDVTDRVATRAENGADGTIYPLREGLNRLRLGVFGRSLWGRWVEDVVEIEIRARPLPPLDRARTAPPPPLA